MLWWLFDSFSTKAWELYCDSYLLSYLLRFWELCYDELHFPYKWGFVHMQWAEAFLFAEVHLFFSLAALFGSDFRTVAMWVTTVTFLGKTMDHFIGWTKYYVVGGHTMLNCMNITWSAFFLVMAFLSFKVNEICWEFFFFGKWVCRV